MKKVIENVLYWLQALLIPVYGCSFIFPRNRKIWLFGSTFGRRFAENPRYLYLYVNEYRKMNIRPIWITKNKEVVKHLRKKELEVYYYHSLRGIFFSLHGGVYIYDNYAKDISFWLSGGAIKINLWHGVGNKKINFDNKFDRVRHPKNNWECFKFFLRRMSDEKPHHYTLATSPVMKEIFASAFGTIKEHIIEEGYPRNDTLFFQKFTTNAITVKEKFAIKDVVNWNKKNKIFFYMPTFRDSEIKFFEVMNLELFNSYLNHNNFMFIVKLHPKSIIIKAFQKIKYSNIINIDAEVDPYNLLKYADVLVTDYSSVYSDYMLMNRPVIGFYYDFLEYSTNTRDGYFDFEDYMPEVKVETMDSLMKAMEEVLIVDACRVRRIQSRDKMFSNCDGNSSQRLTIKLEAIILENTK